MSGHPSTGKNVQNDNKNAERQEGRRENGTIEKVCALAVKTTPDVSQ